MKQVKYYLLNQMDPLQSLIIFVIFVLFVFFTFAGVWKYYFQVGPVGSKSLICLVSPLNLSVTPHYEILK